MLLPPATYFLYSLALFPSMPLRKQPDWRPAAKAALAVLGLLFLSLLALVLVGGTFQGGKIGTVKVRGELTVDGMDDYISHSPGVRETIELIKKAGEDPDVSVILIDINSGGGTIVASKELMRAVRSAEKPVVAYINELGASGAYYAASAADEIIADEDSLTGSIGAVSQVDNYAGLMEKLGLNVSMVASGEYKSMASPFDEFTGEERALLQEIVDGAYGAFRADILKNRPSLDAERLDAVSDGRLLSGRQALEAGLVDHTGSRELALERAAVGVRSRVLQLPCHLGVLCLLSAAPHA